MLFETIFYMYRKDSDMIAVYKDFISLIYNDQLKFPIFTMTRHIQTLISHQLHFSIHTKKITAITDF